MAHRVVRPKNKEDKEGSSRTSMAFFVVTNEDIKYTPVPSKNYFPHIHQHVQETFPKDKEFTYKQFQDAAFKYRIQTNN